MIVKFIGTFPSARRIIGDRNGFKLVPANKGQVGIPGECAQKR